MTTSTFTADRYVLCLEWYDPRGVISGLCIGLAGAINKIGPALIEGRKSVATSITVKRLMFH
jgi:hypothetical protein